ncbi:MAG: c-type cytochrome [Verrucomicrobiales bacterium]
MKFFTHLALAALALLPVAQADQAITFDNLPLGDEKKPLILRTYLPDPGLPDAYFAHHGQGAPSPKYSPNDGLDKKGEYQPVTGLPAAIGVNHGAALSYAFDTVECRLAYAWQGGFLDMYPYWGNPDRGNRLSFNYVPHLVGNLFYQAPAESEILVDGKPLTSLGTPKYLGYDLDKNGVPTFLFKRGDYQFALNLAPDSSAPLSLKLTLSSDQAKSLTLGDSKGEKTLSHTLTGAKIASFQGFPRNVDIKEASIANGQLLYDSLGCSACHSIDGSLGHGPTFTGLYDSLRPVEGKKDPVKADAAYLLESIKDPNALTAKGFPPNYMPPYKLKELEYESLVLFIQSVAKGE